jgi:hypothetical protein
MKTHNYYKVVCLDENNRLISSNTRDDGCCVEYRQGGWTVPSIKNSKLFVFDSREKARAYKRDLNIFNITPYKFYIYKAEIINPGYFTLFHTEIFFKTIEEVFTYEWSNQSLSSNRKCFPSGTVMVDKVKIIEKIY